MAVVGILKNSFREYGVTDGESVCTRKCCSLFLIRYLDLVQIIMTICLRFIFNKCSTFYEYV